MNANAAIASGQPLNPPARTDDDPRLARSRRLIGTVIDGKYLLGDLLGIGTTGAVFRAQNQWAGRPCAVKLFHYEGSNDQLVLRRFVREAQAIHRVQKNGRLHPHVVDALDVGRDRETGCYFVVQELLRGETLGAYLHRLPSRRLSLPNALRILCPVIDAIACAHEGAVVHRDLKPDNIMLTRGSDDNIAAKVLDFGIAQVTDDRVTPVNELMGTPLYMPPESFAGAGQADARADVWALGVILYEVLSGQSPFAHPTEDPMACMELVLHRVPPSLAGLGLVPPTVSNVVRRAMMKSPSQRYANARELLVALDMALRPVRVLRVGTGMSLDQVQRALYDAGQHSWISPPEAPRSIPPPIERRTLPPSTIGVSPSIRPSMTPIDFRSMPPRMSAPPPANDSDAPSDAFTGNPADYWWSVHVASQHTGEQIVRILELPELAHVVELHVQGCPLGDAGIAALMGGANLRDLAVLTLRRVGLTPRGAAAIAGAAGLANLIKLDLEQNALGTDGLRTILAGRHMQNLRALGLVLDELDATAADALLESSKLALLVRLDLSQNQLGDKGALLLAEEAKLSPELWLALSRNRVTPAAVERVTAALSGRVRKLVT